MYNQNFYGHLREKYVNIGSRVWRRKGLPIISEVYMRREIRELFILTGMVLVIFLGSTIVMANHEDIVTSMKEEYNGPDVQEEGTTSAEEEEETSADQNEKDEKSVDSFTGLLIGLDADRGLTDVIMVGHFDAETNEVKIVSVPRDLHIDFREEPFKSIRSDINSRHKNPDTGKYEFILQTAYCKLGEVYYNLGKTEEAFTMYRQSSKRSQE